MTYDDVASDSSRVSTTLKTDYGGKIPQVKLHPIRFENRKHASLMARATVTTEAPGIELPHADDDARLAAGTSALMRIASTVVVARNDTICHDGEPISAHFRVVSGAARASRTLSDGRRLVVDFLFRDDFFGLTGADEYDCTVVALAPTVLQRYPRAQFERLMQRDLDACNLVRRATNAGLAAAQARCMTLAYLSSEERLAAFLRDMARRARAAGRTPLPITRADIGDYLGLAGETVSRAFTKLKARGWIR